MNELVLILIVGSLLFCVGLSAVFLAFQTGFRMGRRTVNLPAELKPEKFDETGKGELNSPDIFTEELNVEGLEDPDKRLRTT